MAGCGGGRDEIKQETAEDLPQVGGSEVLENRLAGGSGELMRSQVSSPIHWQPWSAKSFELADRMDRLVLAMVVLPQQASYRSLLAEFSATPVLVDEINKNYVPVLVDGDVNRELALLSVELCGEIGRNVNFPLLIWMTEKANPVAWIPIDTQEGTSLEKIFMQSHSMILEISGENSIYIQSNSKKDQENRKIRMLSRITQREMSAEPSEDSVKALRQLISMYDPVSRTFDGVGALFPDRILDLLATAAKMEALPKPIQKSSRETLEYLISDLINSPMFDPLEGGVFNSKFSNSWALPTFYSDCGGQARVSRVLMEAYEVTSDLRVLERALGILNYAERAYQTPEGLFYNESETARAFEDWLWKTEDVREILGEQDLAIWMRFSGMKERGNLAADVDPLNRYYRCNTIRYAASAGQISEETGIDLTEVEVSIERSARKLREVRAEKMEFKTKATEAHSGASFQMVEAYAAAYRATGKEAYRERAVEILEKAKGYFSEGPRLKHYASEGSEPYVEGRAFIYALAMKAALDVAAISLEESWLDWADDLATTTVELFADEDFLRECSLEADLLGLPITNQLMYFGDSTVGLMSMNEARLTALGRPVLEPFSRVTAILPKYAVRYPMLHTDLIQSSLLRYYGVKLVYHQGTDPELKKAASRVSPQYMTVVANSESPVDNVTGLVKVRADGSETAITEIDQILDHALHLDAD